MSTFLPGPICHFWRGCRVDVIWQLSQVLQLTYISVAMIYLAQLFKLFFSGWLKHYRNQKNFCKIFDTKYKVRHEYEESNNESNFVISKNQRFLNTISTFNYRQAQIRAKAWDLFSILHPPARQGKYQGFIWDSSSLEHIYLVP